MAQRWLVTQNTILPIIKGIHWWNTQSLHFHSEPALYSISTLSLRRRFDHLTWTHFSFCLPWDKGLQSTIVQLNTWLPIIEHVILTIILSKQREGQEISKWSKESVWWLSCLIVHFPGTLLNSCLISSELGPAVTHTGDCCIYPIATVFFTLTYVIK